MRQINFRGKDINGQWVYGWLWQSVKGTYFITNGSETNMVNPDTAGQQVMGVKDIHSKDIFEGDVIQCKQFFYKDPLLVVWNEVESRFSVMSSDGHKFTRLPNEENDMEVLGNIYDNQFIF